MPQHTNSQSFNTLQKPASVLADSADLCNNHLPDENPLLSRVRSVVQEGGARAKDTATFLAALTAVSVGLPATSQATQGNANLSPVQRTISASKSTKIPGAEQFEVLTQYLEKPGFMFNKAGVTPLWTLSSGEAAGKLPGKTTVVPEDMRPWSPWFRDRLRDGDKVLSAAEVMRARVAVISAVMNDERAEFHVPQNVAKEALTAYWAKRLDGIRIDALNDAGVLKPSNELKQILMADAVNWWGSSWGKYSGEKVDAFFYGMGRYPTPGELLSRNPYVAQCAESAIALRSILRAWERLNETAGSPTGLKANVVSCSRKLPEETSAGPHGIVGVEINCSGNRKMKLLYESVPGEKAMKTNTPAEEKNWIIRNHLMSMGPLDQSSVESFANSYCIDNKLPTKVPDLGSFPGGDMQDIFYLGNYVPVNQNENKSGEDRSWHPWSRWREAHSTERASLYYTLKASYEWAFKKMPEIGAR